MGVYQGRDLRKITGGKKNVSRGKRKFEIGSQPTETKVYSEDIREKARVLGGNAKVRLTYAAYANVINLSDGTAKKVKILEVIESSANREYARRGIIVKGSIIRTEIGKALVTSRPGQHGVINAILMQQ
ncbi:MULTISPECIES: 30S ribosomal protein S8e [Metallosphaera]|uniref:Small ribosomal subunit protein eS8 n=3 Tax=Metallosphaera TaxID=41980 RepID=RS8E_METS5|nr:MULTISPECIES: 30S ribosomal protein S8e [Metallosphaera]A4YD47.1 RecName: Full=Small ribosomal subunit protein eS8; AltName: Full=30S ribosomal protein S8e [Metallosphaera sedula DSM 5348]ABP94349.1 SSU ribosomal protein S8E [Metallosphaera sedula DSM 5348]AIM26336.1 SSU ribosomal protein S8E [Metallosphaera sedula]AKV73344.1 30S ribosomal protein S8e [Metallosphaera sedula]AKV75588.1 30S ribosomal protein S8e [Metallosphaera sedula]AKV77834.1 30S ribosomal protein S8e [Metallosphaera sedu